MEAADKGGTFLGSIILPGPKPLSLGVGLARAGLAKLQPFFSAERSRGGAELVAAIQAAKEARLKVRCEELWPVVCCCAMCAPPVLVVVVVYMSLWCSLWMCQALSRQPTRCSSLP